MATKRPIKFIDLESRKMAFGLGVLTGLVIMATPQIIGAVIVLGLVIGALRMVELGRL